MDQSLCGHFRTLARYNRLANDRLYEACGALSEEERGADRRAFFGSILGTLNHILIGDRIWLTRFEGGEIPSTSLGRILYEDFGALREARTAEDARVDRFADGLSEDFLSESITYVNNDNLELVDPNIVLVAHFFNHQTHHRGQVSAMITQTHVPSPVLDMHRVLFPT